VNQNRKKTKDLIFLKYIYIYINKKEEEKESQIFLSKKLELSTLSEPIVHERQKKILIKPEYLQWQ
jgi:hypothetical protein